VYTLNTKFWKNTFSNFKECSNLEYVHIKKSFKFWKKKSKKMFRAKKTISFFEKFSQINKQKFWKRKKEIEEKQNEKNVN
jgi:hypothetical protein